MYVRRTSCSSCESSSCPSTILPPDAALAASAVTPASRSSRNRGSHAASPLASRSRGALVAPPAAAALSLQSALAATSAGLASRCRRDHSNVDHQKLKISFYFFTCEIHNGSITFLHLAFSPVFRILHKNGFEPIRQKSRFFPSKKPESA